VEHDLGIWSLHYHLEMKPQDIQSRYELARRYTCYRAYRQAVREYLKLLCLEPYYYAARLELADCYTRLEMWQEAARELRLLTMVSGYAQDAWQRLAALDQQMPRPFTQHEADAQQHVWEMLHK
jgi:tetratricopeptide (TPR) repeat protein